MSGTSLGLALQRLNQFWERVLVVAHVASEQSEDGWLRAAEINHLFDRLRVPKPGNVYQSLAGLQKSELVIQSGKKWTVTPIGSERAREILEEMDVAEIEASQAASPGSVLGNAIHSVLAPEFAPPRWIPAIEQLLGKCPFETNVFLMTRFPKNANDDSYLDPIEATLTVARQALADHGLTLHLASDRQLDDDLLSNVAAHMWACHYGIGIFEDRLGHGLNYNVITEIGAMLMTGRRCALLKDTTAPNLPTDIAGQIYKPVDLDDPEAIGWTIHAWVANDLGFGPCKNCAH